MNVAITGQFEAVFDILDGAIPSFSPSQWASGSPPFNGPARVVAHALQCAVFYTTEDRADFESFAKPVWQLADDELPSQARLIELSADARNKTLAWVAGMTPDLLAEADDEGRTGLQRVLYAMRHLQHHVGELCAYQKQHGLEPAEWR